MRGPLLDASPMADEAGYEYEGTLTCTVGGSGASITDNHQCMVGEEAAYQHWSNAAFDDVGAGPSYVVATMKPVEHEANDHVSLNEPHARHVPGCILSVRCHFAHAECLRASPAGKGAIVGHSIRCLFLKCL